MSRGIRVAHLTTVDLTLRFLLLGQLRRLRDEGYDVTAISAPGPWTAELEAEGIRHIAWPHATRSWNLGADLKAFLELVAILRRERFDLVHTHNPKPGVMGRIAAQLAGVPCVVNTVHGLYATPEDRALKRLPVLSAERLAARCSDLELYQSEEDLEWARRLRLLRVGQGVLLGNGVDVSRFDPAAVPRGRVSSLRREWGIPRDALVAGTVGRLVAEKGYGELALAARSLRTQFPNMQFLVVGETDPSKQDAISAEELEAEGFRVTGWRDDVSDLLALMDVFVLPSWREGVPRSAIEAAAAGKPLVVTDIRGCREVVRDGIEGLLVPPRDAARLAEAIATLLREPKLRARMGRVARARAVDRFDERAVEEIVVREYRELLGRKGLRAPGSVTDDSPLVIRKARAADAAAMARLHRESLPGAFLSSLGDRFLRRLYVALIRDPGAVVLVGEDGSGVIGFAAGVPSVRAFYRRFAVRDGLRAALAATPQLARPSVLRRARETASYPSRAAHLGDAELLSIAVDAGRRADGIGRALADGVVHRLAGRGIRELKVVAGVGNGEVAFYERVGFRPAGRIDVHRGETSQVLVRSCGSS